MKSFPAKRVGFVLLALLVASGALLAADIPLANWTVPPYQGRPVSSGGITTMTDISPGVAFVALEPCRIVDTRGGGVFVGAYGPPALVANATRNFDINSAPHCTGIPSGVEAYSLNFTVVNTAGGPGDLRAWPTGSPPVLTTSVLNWTAANVIIANATIIGAGTGGQIDVTAAGFGTQLLIDINGYFTGEYNNGVPFIAIANVPGGSAIVGYNTNTTSINSDGGDFISDSCFSGSSGVFGTNTSISGASCGFVLGVWGTTSSTVDTSAGVFGLEGSPSGVVYGVAGVTNSATNAATGVAAFATNGGRTYGVYGESNGIASGAAGVFGVAAGGITASSLGFGGVFGVRGDSRSGIGVHGLAEGRDTFQRGVSGLLVDQTTGAFLASGELGYDAGVNNYGVFAGGNYGGTGAKYFVEPHPERADLVIRYVALEGPEAGTYFRGRARFQNGLAAIEVPEDFRLVTDPDSLTVQVTPIGEMATVGVVQISLDRIVVRGSRNVEFSYMVNGVRKTHKNLTPIGPGQEYMPPSSNATMPSYLTEGQKRILVLNGTYNPDGTVNMETARRLGWNRKWEERERPSPELVSASAAAGRSAIPELPLPPAAPVRQPQ